jgi:transmembrane sensor
MPGLAAGAGWQLNFFSGRVRGEAHFGVVLQTFVPYAQTFGHDAAPSILAREVITNWLAALISIPYSMLPEVTSLLFNQYVQGTTSLVEAEAVRRWLAQPANQLLAQLWMQQHWDSLPAEPFPTDNEPDYESLLSSLHGQLGFGQPSQLLLAPSVVPWWRRWVAAAAVSVTLGAGGWLLNSQRVAAPLELATAYGQTHVVQLPDGSEVTLNGHSRLRYAPHWAANKPREVWLDGEAYFSVTHQPNNQHFLVHTQAGFHVEVLGTKFTVYRRREQARVVLLSGKVRVDFDDQQRPDVVLKPGELLETRDVQPTAVIHKPVHTAPYSSWKDAKLVLDETTIEELATRLQDTYGLEVVVQTSELNQRKVTGTVPLRNLDVLLLALEEAFHLKASRQGNRIVLADKSIPHPQSPSHPSSL